ncbi:hypothetical protein, partial [Agrobacterium tumefaciens]|uniref:hypothetical protein n=2 Tax=Rhizobium/Agrobacterium group TaxID=227290 RepID=UPI001AEC36B4
IAAWRVPLRCIFQFQPVDQCACPAAGCPARWNDNCLNRRQRKLPAMNRSEADGAHDGGESAEVSERADEALLLFEDGRYVGAKMGDSITKGVIVQDAVRK